MNNLTITGRLTRDAEQRYTQSGTAMLKFSVANNTGFGDKQKTNYFDCVLWGKRAEGRLIDFLKKGQEVAVNGEVELNTYQKQDGTQGASLSVNARAVDLIGKRSDDTTQSTNETPMEKAADFIDEEIPF